jgi:pimeloyl-ACP methyl ester carboxylesterase
LAGWSRRGNRREREARLDLLSRSRLTGLGAQLPAQCVASRPYVTATVEQHMPHDFESIDLGGRALRYICCGAGTPTVIVDQGQGISIEQGFARSVAAGWAKVFVEIQKSTRICMHDRAGLGSSDGAITPRTSLDMINDWRSLLREARIAPPYLLVGHSIGGFNVRVFASKYPDEVLGMVLVDSSHPAQLARFSEFLPPESPGEPVMLRLLRHGPDPSSSPERIDFRESAEQVRTTATLGLKPLVVLSQSPQALQPPGLPPEIRDNMPQAWAELQNSLLSLSGNSRQVIANHAGHNIQLEEPQLVIDAILSVLHETRSRKPRMH